MAPPPRQNEPRQRRRKKIGTEITDRAAVDSADYLGTGSEAIWLALSIILCAGAPVVGARHEKVAHKKTKQAAGHVTPGLASRCIQGTTEQSGAFSIARGPARSTVSFRGNFVSQK
ncbi:MAG: hypothetical protein C0524_06455 [Rhodobacter sp.]|nr:hypothetical protein [Rhodobacter sp.]